VIAEASTGRYQLLCANCNWIKRYENREHYPRVEGTNGKNEEVVRPEAGEICRPNY
jgi:hypothetical protein